MNTKERKIDEMAIVYRRLDTIKPLPGNAKLHDIQGIAGSISDSGFIDPIAVNIVTGHDIDGNGRLEALKMLYAEGKEPPPKIRLVTEKVDGKMATVWYAPTIDVHFDAETEPIVAMRLNRSHDKGGYDERKVFDVLEQAAAHGRLDQTGFDQGILDVLAIKYSDQPEPTVNESTRQIQDGGSAKKKSPDQAADQKENYLPLQPSQPEYMEVIQIFMNTNLKVQFLTMCNALIREGIAKDDGNHVETLAELVFTSVQRLTEQNKEQV